MTVSLSLEITELNLALAMLISLWSQGLQTMARSKLFQYPPETLSLEYKRNLLAADSISPCQQLLISWCSIHSPILLGAQLLLHPQLLSFGKLLTLDFNSFKHIFLLPQISKQNDFPASTVLAAVSLTLEDTFRHSVPARRSLVTISKQQTNRFEGMEQWWNTTGWPLPCQSRCSLHAVHILTSKELPRALRLKPISRVIWCHEEPITFPLMQEHHKNRKVPCALCSLQYDTLLRFLNKTATTELFKDLA